MGFLTGPWTSQAPSMVYQSKGDELAVILLGPVFPTFIQKFGVKVHQSEKSEKKTGLCPIEPPFWVKRGGNFPFFFGPKVAP